MHHQTKCEETARKQRWGHAQQQQQRPLLSSAGRQAEAGVSEAAHAVPRLGRAVCDAQVGGEVAGPGKLLGAEVAGVLDPERPVHLHVPVEAAARRKRPVARAAEGTRGPSSAAACRCAWAWKVVHCVSVRRLLGCWCLILRLHNPPQEIDIRRLRGTARSCTLRVTCGQED